MNEASGASCNPRCRRLQEELGQLSRGHFRGGVVTVRMNREDGVKAVKIDPSLIKPDETRDPRDCGYCA